MQIIKDTSSILERLELTLPDVLRNTFTYAKMTQNVTISDEYIVGAIALMSFDLAAFLSKNKEEASGQLR
jgi:hypothetical protein